MHVVKAINHNAVLCVDGYGKELVVFGKGIGFTKPPYELEDLSKVERTFYDVSSDFIQVLNNIPSDIILFTAKMVDKAAVTLQYALNPNVVFTLADHISFTIERAKKKIYIEMPNIYDMEILYPEEVRIAKYIVRQINMTFDVKLPPNEVQGIAMHFLNARGKTDNDENAKDTLEREKLYREMLEETTQIIEEMMGIEVKRKTFNYARYASHIQFLLKRLADKKGIDSDNYHIYASLKAEYPEVSNCVNEIARYYTKVFEQELSEEEKLYLFLHVNRVCTNKNN